MSRSTNKPPQQRQGGAATRQVRDGLPTVPELLRAMRLLQIPLDAAKVRELPLERQRTVLLALLGSWAEVYLYAQRTEDELDTQEFHDVAATADEIPARGDRRIQHRLVQQRIERAHATAHEVAEQFDPFSVGGPLTGLLRAAGAVNDAWVSPYRDGPLRQLSVLLEGVANPDAGTRTVLRMPPDPSLLRVARDQAAAAIEQIDAALESPEVQAGVVAVDVPD